METIIRLKPDQASPSARPRCCASSAPRQAAGGALRERPGWRGRGAAARGQSAALGGHTAALPPPPPERGPRAAHLRRPAATGGDRAECRGGRSGSSAGTAAAPLHAPRRRSGDGRGSAVGGVRWAVGGEPHPRGSVAVGVAVLGVPAAGTGKHGPCGLASVRGKEAPGTARRGSGAVNEAGRNVRLGGGLRVGHLLGGEGTAKEI